MLFSSLLFVLLKLKINFGRVTRGYVLSKKQFSLEISGRFLTMGEEQLVEQKLHYFFKKNRTVYRLIIIWVAFPKGGKKHILGLMPATGRISELSLIA